MSLAELETNKFSINNEYFNLPKLIWNSLEVFQHEATKKKVALEAKISKKSDLNLLCKLYGDPLRYT